MSGVKQQSGGDFMFSKLDRKLEPMKLKRGPTPVELDEVERLLDDSAGNGKKLADGVKAADASIMELGQCGLTPDALVLLVHAKCGFSKGNAVSETTVRVVLEALFRLGEHLR